MHSNRNRQGPKNLELSLGQQLDGSFRHQSRKHTLYKEIYNPVPFETLGVIRLHNIKCRLFIAKRTDPTE